VERPELHLLAHRQDSLLKEDLLAEEKSLKTSERRGSLTQDSAKAMRELHQDSVEVLKK
jgi:hypothetical protein